MYDDSQEVLVYCLSGNGCTTPVTCAQVKEAIDDSFTHDSVPKYIPWPEQRDGYTNRLLDQTIGQYCVGENYWVFQADLMKRVYWDYEDGKSGELPAPSITYVLTKAESLARPRLVITHELGVSESSLPTKLLYPESRRSDGISMNLCEGKDHGGVENWYGDKVTGQSSRYLTASINFFRSS